jgi:hypothetical protein
VGSLGEIFRAHGEEYRARFAERMSLDQLRAMRDIEACHTPAAGEALWRCPRCGKRHFTFVGCGNRHCPGCGATRAEQWRRKHSALLLPGVVYHLVTFTVPEIFAQIKPSVWKHKNWVVHSKPVGTGETTLSYLARYVHRVALSEKAILRHRSDSITLRYRKSGSNRVGILRLKPHEFIRRFLQHVLPSGFRKVRYFGLHHSSKRPTLSLLQAAMAIRHNLPLPPPPPPAPSLAPSCPGCQTPMHFEGRFAAAKRPCRSHRPMQVRAPP